MLGRRPAVERSSPPGASPVAHEASNCATATRPASRQGRAQGRRCRQRADFRARVGRYGRRGQVLIDATPLANSTVRPNKIRLGANAILGVSLAAAWRQRPAICRCAATSTAWGHVPPVPHDEPLNGGAARRQPSTSKNSDHAVGRSYRRGSARLARKFFNDPAQDAQGRRPQHQCRRRGWLRSAPAADGAALDFAVKAIEKGGSRPGATSPSPSIRPPREFSGTAATTSMAARARPATATRQIAYPGRPRRAIPILVDRGRHGGGRLGRLEGLTDRIGGKCQLVGDDVFVTNPPACRRASSAASPIPSWSRSTRSGPSPKPSVAVEMAHTAGYTAVMSHRSGETEDLTIADLAGRRPIAADQDRITLTLRSDCEIQPAASHRGGVG